MAVPCGLLYGLKFYSDLLCEIRHFLHFSFWKKQLWSVWL